MFVFQLSYKVDDFSGRGWTPVFLADYHRHYLNNLMPFTDYIIKLLCLNEKGAGPEVMIRARTAEAGNYTTILHTEMQLSKCPATRQNTL